jgi:hypothetical protein
MELLTYYMVYKGHSLIFSVVAVVLGVGGWVGSSVDWTRIIAPLVALV